MPYRERVPTDRLFFGFIVVLALGLIVGAVVSFAADGLVVGIAMLLALAFPVVLWLWFGALEVAVDQDTLRMHFGPFGQTLTGHDIVGARPERYRWWVFGGWGIRFSTRRRRAYTVPFERRSVAITMRDGREWHISTQRADALTEAVQAIAPRPPSDEQTANLTGST